MDKQTYKQHVNEVESNPCPECENGHQGYHNDTSCPPHSLQICPYLLEEMGIEDPTEALMERAREARRQFEAARATYQRAEVDYDMKLDEYRKHTDDLVYYDTDYMIHNRYLCKGDKKVKIPNDVWTDIHHNPREGALRLVDLALRELGD